MIFHHQSHLWKNSRVVAQNADSQSSEKRGGWSTRKFSDKHERFH